MRDFRARRGACLLTLSLSLACLKGEAPPGAELPPPPATLPAAPCVYFRALEAFLPEKLAGYERGEEKGSTGRYGEVSVSEAERSFTRGEGREVTVRIVDTTLAEKLGRAIRSAVDESRDRDPADPTAPLLLDAAQGFVRYDAEEASAEANLLVGERFVVAVTTHGYPGTGQVREVARSLDLTGLARLR